MEKEICKWYEVCPMKKFSEQGRLDKKWIENYCFRGGENCKRLEMESKGIFHPDNMLPDGTIDKTLK
jgi:hypothetical protein